MPDAAQADWEEVRTLLGKWEGVEGVKELEQECELILEGKQAD